MDSVRWVVEGRVNRRVESEAYDLSSSHSLVMFDEKQRFSRVSPRLADSSHEEKLFDTDRGIMSGTVDQ